MPRSGMAMTTFTALMLIGNVAAPKGMSHQKEKVAMAKEAKVDLAQASSKAMAKVPGQAIEVELAKKKGKVLWEVEILTADGKLMEVDVDAISGEVVDSENKK